jgi:hypothetical protein
MNLVNVVHQTDIHTPLSAASFHPAKRKGVRPLAAAPATQAKKYLGFTRPNRLKPGGVSIPQFRPTPLLKPREARGNVGHSRSA